MSCPCFAFYMYCAQQIETLAKRFDREHAGKPPHVRTKVHSSSAAEAASDVATDACLRIIVLPWAVIANSGRPVRRCLFCSLVGLAELMSFLVGLAEFFANFDVAAWRA